MPAPALNTASASLKKIKLLVCFFCWSAFVLLLFYSDFPLPHGDDLFFAGTAVHYSETGNFFNPGVLDYTGQFSEIKKPYWFVPLHMRTMGWWLWITGVSDASIRSYVITCMILTSLVLVKWSHLSFKKTNLAIWLMPIIVAFGFRWSLRPECTAIPLWTIGTFFLFHFSSHKSSWAGFSFLGLSCLASQIMLLPSLCLSLAFLISENRNRNENPYTRLCLLLACMVQTILVGIWLIEFETIQFIRMFLDHIGARSSSIAQNLNFFYFMTCVLGNGHLIRLPTFLILIVLSLLVLVSKRKDKVLITSIFISIVLMICIYAKSFELILFFATFTSLIVLFEFKKWSATILIAVTMVVFVRQGLHHCAYGYFCDRSKQYAKIDLTTNQTYVIDEYVIRHPLNWQFPKHWKIAPDFYTTNERLLKKPDSETWIVSLKNLAYFYPDLYSQKKLMMGNKEFTNLPVKFWEYLELK